MAEKQVDDPLLVGGPLENLMRPAGRPSEDSDRTRCVVGEASGRSAAHSAPFFEGK